MFSLRYYLEYMSSFLLTNCNPTSILLVVMETKVSTLVIWLFWKFIEGIRLNFVLLSTKLKWTFLSMIGMHFYKIV